VGGLAADPGRNPGSAPTIEIETISHGPLPEAPRLNPKLSAQSPLLRATLRIAWEPGDGVETIAALEESLLAFSPRFRDHECRGAEAYHVFRRGRPRGKEPDGGSDSRGASVSYVPALALAHLIEHALIDVQCRITGARRCSGATAQRADGPDRYDIMVESPDPRAGRCSLALALAWVCQALAGHPLGVPEREILEVARRVFDSGNGALHPAGVARSTGLPEARVAEALEALAQLGCLKRDAAGGGYRLRDLVPTIRT
jgi:hypothetical protein